MQHPFCEGTLYSHPYQAVNAGVKSLLEWDDYLLTEAKKKGASRGHVSETAKKNALERRAALEAEVLYVLRKHTHGLSNSQLLEKIGVGQYRLMEALIDLVTIGKVHKERRGKCIFYFLRD